MLRETITGLRTALLLWVLTAIFYPLLILLVGQIVFPYQANGSLITNNQTPIGSALIGQPFASDRYFLSRPSTTSYSTADPKDDKNNILKTGISGASNLDPSNPALQEQVQTNLAKLQQANITPTADLIYTSGSSLDPHISLEAARAQIQRVAAARGLNTNQVEILVSKHTEGRFLGIFGEPGVNVLKLNIALDSAAGTPR